MSTVHNTSKHCIANFSKSNCTISDDSRDGGSQLTNQSPGAISLLSSHKLARVNDCTMTLMIRVRNTPVHEKLMLLNCGGINKQREPKLSSHTVNELCMVSSTCPQALQEIIATLFLIILASHVHPYSNDLILYSTQ